MTTARDQLEHVAAPVDALGLLDADPRRDRVAERWLPRMPKMVVSQSGLCCLPGMIALASRPSTNPTMIAHNQPMAASSYGSA